ncbi:unnamed protein product, partial [Mesorhabditis spiculigera]
MGICFVGKRKNFEEFMDQYIEPQPGPLVTIDGKFLAEHQGVHHFTLGKRIHLKGDHLGYFVADIQPATNTVVVCSGSHHPLLYADEFLIKLPAWISRDPIDNTQMGEKVIKAEIGWKRHGVSDAV